MTDKRYSSSRFEISQYSVRSSNNSSGTGGVNIDCVATNEDGAASAVNIRFYDTTLRAPKLHSDTQLEMFMSPAMLAAVIAQLDTGRSSATYEAKLEGPIAYIDSDHLVSKS